jgi:hypothetical protein
VNPESAVSALGVVFVAVGFAMLFVPGLAGLFDANELFLTLVGLGFALQTVRVVNARRQAPYEQADTADPEVAQELPTPGDEFDDLLEEAAAVRYSAKQRDAVRERLRAAAVAVIVRTEGLSREQAIARLEDGSWTEDPYAAAFFTGEIGGASVLQRVSLFDRSRSQFERWSTHAAREIVELSEGENA